MLNNNFRFILRRLWRQKLHTFSHLLGLTLGISVCLLIGLFLHHELSFDTYHEKADRIYRVNQIWEEASGEKDLDYSTPAPLATALREEVPSLEQVVTVFPQSETMIEVSPNKRYMQEGMLLTEASFLDVFKVEVLEGNAYEALRQPDQTLLTLSTARKFFGDENPIGKTLKMDGDRMLTVTGIIKDFPSNTHLPASMLASYVPSKEYLGFNPNSWMMTFGASTYVVLEKGADIASLEAPINAIYDKNFNDKYSEFGTSNGSLQALSDIHFETQYNSGGKWVKATNPKWLWFFGIIGLIVLALACINFINLSTAQSLSRAKEVGVRKAIGAAKRQLILQFLNEAALLIFCSTLLALTITFFVLPSINTLLDKSIDFAVLFSPIGIIVLLVFMLLTSLLTGLYPAWLIAKFQPALSLKTARDAGDGRTSFFRKFLITTQFAVSGAMLIALLFVAQQMKFFYQKNLGFDKENIVTFEVPDSEKINVLSNELRQVKGVKSLSFNSSVPSALSRSGTVMHKEDYMAEDSEDVSLIFGDAQYSEVFDLQLKAGRYYKDADTTAISEQLADDQLFPKVLVNEQLLEAMNFGTPEQALGERFKIGWNDWQPEIVGVVENFVTSSLHESIKPSIIFQVPDFLDQVSIKLYANTDLPTTLNDIRMIWEQNFPDQIYDYQFLDEQIEAYYESESLLFSFFKLFATLAMLISCIGLWGLATHAAIQRNKEIGIRKVLGASVTNVVTLLAKDFVKLVIIALLIAIPITWYLVQQWLQNFAYAIEIQWWVFALASLIAIGIALLTVSFQSLRAALANPVKSLRSE